MNLLRRALKLVVLLFGLYVLFATGNTLISRKYKRLLLGDQIIILTFSEGTTFEAALDLIKEYNLKETILQQALKQNERKDEILNGNWLSYISFKYLGSAADVQSFVTALRGYEGVYSVTSRVVPERQPSVTSYNVTVNLIDSLSSVDASILYTKILSDLGSKGFLTSDRLAKPPQYFVANHKGTGVSVPIKYWFYSVDEFCELMLKDSRISDCYLSVLE